MITLTKRNDLNNSTGRKFPLYLWKVICIGSVLSLLLICLTLLFCKLSVFYLDLQALIKSMSMRVNGLEGVNWQCTMCEYNAQNKTNLTNHIEKNHLDQSYHCPKCNKELKSRHALKLHIQRIHDDEPQNCHICAIMFPSRKVLKAHMKSHC